jgi:hypothetical protein
MPVPVYNTLRTQNYLQTIKTRPRGHNLSPRTQGDRADFVGSARIEWGPPRRKDFIDNFIFILNIFLKHFD